MLEGGVALKIVERDYLILKSITKFRFCLSRQIRILAGFTGQRNCNRRLKLLADSGFLVCKHMIYGIAPLYFATPKAKEVFSLPFVTANVRMEQVVHDIAVIDTAIFFMQQEALSLADVLTERELKNRKGFGTPTHLPDFVFHNQCVEVELSLKSAATLERNFKKNYLAYDGQYWIIDFDNRKLKTHLEALQKTHENIQLINLTEVKKVVEEK